MDLMHIMVSSFNLRYKLIVYKNRYLIIYIIIGFLSLVLEQFIIRFLNGISENVLINSSIAFVLGVVFAFIFNAKFNFKVPRNRLVKSMFYFFLISFLSLITQNQLKDILQINSNLDRYIISGFLFFFFYLLHRNTSFKSRKKVGLAIHLNETIDVNEIFERVSNYPDFIHIDLIDESINKNNISTDFRVLDKILKNWPNKEVQLHLMSRNHEFWFSKLEKYSDRLKIFIHDDKGEKLKNLKNQFSIFDISLVVTQNSNFEDSLLEELEEIICLCVEHPGYSGQIYRESMDEIIQKYINLKNIYNFKITLDGGITNNIASKFDVENFVSASYVLNSSNSRKKIVDLQTADKYDHNE